MHQRVLRSCTADLTQNSPGSSVQEQGFTKQGLDLRTEGMLRVQEPQERDHRERTCHFCRSHGRLSFGGSLDVAGLTLHTGQNSLPSLCTGKQHSRAKHVGSL